MWIEVVVRVENCNYFGKGTVTEDVISIIEFIKRICTFKNAVCNMRNLLTSRKVSIKAQKKT